MSETMERNTKAVMEATVRTRACALLISHLAARAQHAAGALRHTGRCVRRVAVSYVLMPCRNGLGAAPHVPLHWHIRWTSGYVQPGVVEVYVCILTAPGAGVGTGGHQRAAVQWLVRRDHQSVECVVQLQLPAHTQPSPGHHPCPCGARVCGVGST